MIRRSCATCPGGKKKKRRIKWHWKKRKKELGFGQSRLVEKKGVSAPLNLCIREKKCKVPYQAKQEGTIWKGRNRDTVEQVRRRKENNHI